MEVSPEDAAADVFRGMKHGMVIVPVNSNANKTEDIAKKDQQQRFQRRQLELVRHLQFQNHYCDDYGKHAVAECFQSVLFHRETGRQ